jgi:hypothetical protein
MKTPKAISRETARGSRRQVLEWVEQPEFLAEINEILRPTGAVIAPDAPWMPRGFGDSGEGRLENLGPEYLPTATRDKLRGWWLKHGAGANTPNWDFLSPCRIDGKPGLVLIEAKANKRELSEAGKRQSAEASQRSRENHAQICDAIADASANLRRILPGVSLKAESHYQIANRIAFAWKLASMGIPVVLIYLGFTGDDGIRDAGEPFKDAKDWRAHFEDATHDIFPSTSIRKKIDCGAAPFWLLVEAHNSLSKSPTRTEVKRLKLG